MNALEWMSQCGPIAWILLLCFLLAIGVFLERMFHLRRAQIAFRYFLKGVFNVVARGNIEEAIALCDDTPGPIANLMRTAILHRNDDSDLLEAELTRMGHVEISRMERRLSVISSIAQLAPVLGLLGTFLGILEAIQAYQAQSVLVRSDDMAGALIKACATSILGLMVAIPTHGMFTLLVVRIDRIVLQMEEATSQITAFFRDGPTPPAASKGDPHG
ncbi:MAG: MotA/TolQ/ExbB proton channel family protein [Kiritimatiellia bacterium]|jgi:biopolymer transport protein ExbB